MQTNGKYLVLKMEDVEEFLSEDMKARLGRMTRRIGTLRAASKRPVENKYLVVNQDEPFIASMFGIMKDNGINIQP